MAAQSLLPSIAAQIPISKPKTLTLYFTSLSFKLSPSSLSNCGSRSFVSSRKARSFGSGFVRNAVTSPEVEEASGGEQPSFSPDLKLFVGNIPFTVDSSELADLFERAGTVEVIYDKLTGRSRGFGFVTMSTINEVEAAAQQFNGYELSGRSLRVNAGPPPPRDGPLSRGPRVGSSTDSSNRVYVGNLPWGADNLALETLFGEQGKVMEAKVVYDRESGRSRGFGFVTYSSAEEADNAISSLDGIDLDGKTIRVTIAEISQGANFKLLCSLKALIISKPFSSYDLQSPRMVLFQKHKCML